MLSRKRKQQKLFELMTTAEDDCYCLYLAHRYDMKVQIHRLGTIIFILKNTDESIEVGKENQS